jgi:two-component system, NarL family, sensor kinase
VPRRRLAWLTVAVLTSLLVGAIGWFADFDAYVGDPVMAPAMTLAYGLLGPWVARGGVWVIGWRMGLVGLTSGVSWAAQTWSQYTLAAWLSQWTWMLPIFLVPLVLIRFPDGTVPGRARQLEPALLVLALTPVALLAIGALGAPHSLLSGGAPRPAWASALVFAAIGASALWLVGCVLTGLLLLSRARRAEGRERAQIACLGIGLVGVLAGIGLLIAGAPTIVEVLVAASLPTAVAAAVLRYALYDLDLVVNRVLVWSGLTVVVAAGFVGLVALLSLVLPGDRVTPTQLIALLLLALAVEPLRRRLQRGVDRLLFGRRSAPAEAFAEVGRDLARATVAGSGEVLCSAIATTLQLPWAGIRRADGSMSAAWGRRIDDVRAFPLRIADRTLGELLVCPRRLNQRWTRAERAILDGMAAQVAVAVEAMDLAESLRRAQDRIVASREQERERLRNDLHDGLGPTLVGLRLQAAFCARQTKEPAVSAALEQIAAVAAQCVAEVSEVVEGLRPTVLDKGLQAAVEIEAHRLNAGATDVAVVTPEPLPALPQAVETAGLRIVCEAMSNAVRHAQADRVQVEMCVVQRPGRKNLLLTVTDDGCGFKGPRDGGVGLTSMRQRADEVGGWVSIAPATPKGTTVTAELPIRSDTYR